MNEHLIQTGRTTRMLEKAIELALQHRAVYVMVPTRELARWTEKRLEDLWLPRRLGDGGHGIQVEVLNVHSPDYRHFDWGTQRYRDAHENCVFLLDHCLVEQEIERLQAEMRHLAGLVGKLYPLTV